SRRARTCRKDSAAPAGNPTLSCAPYEWLLFLGENITGDPGERPPDGAFLFKFPPCVEFRHQGPVILQGAAPAQLHRWRQLAVLDGKTAVQNFELADLLELLKLPVYLLDSALDHRLRRGGI